HRGADHRGRLQYDAVVAGLQGARTRPALGDALRAHMARADAVRPARSHPVSRRGRGHTRTGVVRWPGANGVGPPAGDRRAFSSVTAPLACATTAHFTWHAVRW